MIITGLPQIGDRSVDPLKEPETINPKPFRGTLCYEPTCAKPSTLKHQDHKLGRGATRGDAAGLLVNSEPRHAKDWDLGFRN